MNDLIVSQFVSPSPRPELNGELGLDLHEIAQSLGVPFKNVKEKFLRMQKDGRISGAVYTAQQLIQEVTGHSYTKEVESYVLDLDSAKFFVAKWDSEVGDAYTRFLIQCEKKLEKAQFQLETLFTNPRKGIELLTKVAELKEEKEALEARIPQLEADLDYAVKTKAWIADKSTATAMATASVLSRKNKALREENQSLRAQFESDSSKYVSYDAYAKLRGLPKLSNYHKGQLFREMAEAGYLANKMVLGEDPYPSTCFKVEEFDNHFKRKAQ